MSGFSVDVNELPRPEKQRRTAQDWCPNERRVVPIKGDVLGNGNAGEQLRITECGLHLCCKLSVALNSILNHGSPYRVKLPYGVRREWCLIGKEKEGRW